jgi:hypothetical protein
MLCSWRFKCIPFTYSMHTSNCYSMHTSNCLWKYVNANVHLIAICKAPFYETSAGGIYSKIAMFYSSLPENCTKILVTQLTFIPRKVYYSVGIMCEGNT